MILGRKKRLLRVVVLAVAAGVAVFFYWRSARPQVITITGAIIRQNDNPTKQAPINDVEVTAADNVALNSAKSDTSGLFRLTLRPDVKVGQMVTLRFVHPGYRPLVVTEPVGNRLYIARMAPVVNAPPPPPVANPVSISNMTVSYTLRTTTALNVGSAVKTFVVVNTPNIPCKGQNPCSPDGRWKAATSSVMLDAGEGNQFRRSRVSCIAGPCPFTKIDSEEVSKDRRTITFTVRAWSAPATFLAQAEVVREVSENVVRRLYPVIFGNDLNFTLPPEAEGPSIEAEVDGADIVFPLDPDPCLTWADCHLRVDSDQTRVFRCEIKPGYQFR